MLEYSFCINLTIMNINSKKFLILFYSDSKQQWI